MKRLSVFLMAAALGVSSLSCPASVFARNPVVQNGVGADNFTIKTTFSDGLDAGSLDVYRIFFRLLDEDSRMGHIDVDANDTKLSARVVPGDYQVIRIKYIGSSKELKKEPAATKTFFRVYNDQVTTVPLAIGQEAVDKLTDKIGVGELYKEVDVNSTVEDTSNENDVTLNSPYVDKGVFDDDTVRESYLQDLTNNGYLDADGNLTDSGKRIQDALEQKGMKYETARQEAILNGMSLEEYLGLTDKDSKESKKGEREDSSSGSTQAEASASDAEETRFDEESNKPKEKTAKDRFVSSLVSICILGVLAFGVFIYLKKRY